LLDDDESIGQLEAAGDENQLHSKCAHRAIHLTGLHFFRRGMPNLRATTGNGARDAGSAIVEFIRRSRDEESRRRRFRSLGLERERGSNVATGVCNRVSMPWWASGGRHSGSLCCVSASANSLSVYSQRRGATACCESPASEQGQKGMDELHQQTVNLLSFQDAAQRFVRTKQVAFNMIRALRAEFAAVAGVARSARASPLSSDCWELTYRSQR